MDAKELIKIVKDVIDYLSPLQTPTEQSIYNYLLRWSYLENGKNQVQVGDRTLAKEVSKPAKGKLSKSKGLAPSTVSDCIRDLVKKGHIDIIEINRNGKIYKVKLPLEVEESLKLKNEKNGDLRKESPEDYFTDSERRKIVFERDKWFCHYCGDKVTDKNATLDHLNPQSKGGKHNKDNLKTCCLVCNSIKSGKTYEEAAPFLLKSIRERKQKEG